MMMSMMMVALKNGVCVLKELWKLSSSLTYYVRLLLPDKKRVMSSKNCLYPVHIFGFQIVFAVVTREVSGGKNTVFWFKSRPVSPYSEEFVLVNFGAWGMFVSVTGLIKIDLLESQSQIEVKVKAFKKFPAIRSLETVRYFCSAVWWRRREPRWFFWAGIKPPQWIL